MVKHITFMGGSMRLSLFAATSAAAVLTGAALAPGAALAANECGDPGANGATADTFACTGTLAAIAYPSTNGALTLTLTNGPTVTTGGLSVTGTGANAVLINRSDATVGGGDPSITNTGGAGIQATTDTGALTLTLTDGDLTGDAPLAVTGTTRGVQLQSGATTGTALNLTFTNGSISATGAGGIGVMATTTSVGAGSIALNLGGAVSGATGVRAVSNGTAALNVTATGLSSTVLGGDIVGTNGPAIQVTPGAAATVIVGAGRTVWANNSGGAVIEVTNINATRSVGISIQGPVLNTDIGSGVLRSSDASVSGYDDLIVLVAGGAGNATINNSGTMQGRVSLLNTGNATTRVSELWHTFGVSTIGLGSSTGLIDVARAGVLGTNADGAATTFAFGDGTDSFTITGGLLRVGEGAEAASTLVITGLETFTNSGRIVFGGSDELLGEVSDGVGNDRITLSGAAATYTGTTSGNGSDFRTSTMIMDADLGLSQADCSAAVSADCLDLRGGATAGSTAVAVNVIGIGGGAERVVLVDVAGAGTSGAGHFVLSPESSGYLPLGGAGGVVDGGFFLYGLTYDAAAKQHVLAPATIDGEGLELGLVGRASNVAWQTTTGSWLTRQADLRGGLADREGSGLGAWLKIAGNFVEDEVVQTYAFGPDLLDFDNGYSQRTAALVGGIDLVNAMDGNSAWVVGVTAGRVDSSMEFYESPTELQFEGHSYGLYASFANEALFVDAIVNAVKLDTEYAAPSADIAGVQGEVESLGYQVEGGWRFSSADGSARLEPLVTLAYVKSDLGDLAFSNVDVAFDEAVSFRGALGVRYAGELVADAFTTQFSLTGRVWQEFEGENAAVIVTPDASFGLADDTADTFGDVGAALSVFAGRGFSASLNYGVRFKEAYLSTDASLSLRLNW